MLGGSNPLGEKTKRFQEISGKKTLGIPSLLIKQDLRGQIQLSAATKSE